MQKIHIPLSERPADQQPDRKLYQFGADVMSNAELLAILLRTGSRGQSALELSQQILHHVNNNLRQLAGMKPHELQQIKGIGFARSLVISAAMEIGRRKHGSPNIEKMKISSSRDVAFFLQSKVGELGYEIFGVIYLNRANRVIHHEIISKGGITGTVADTRIILKNALIHGAVGILLFHNHPSGNLQPSHADIQLTVKIKKAADYMDIKLLDHLIITSNGYASLLDEGVI